MGLCLEHCAVGTLLRQVRDGKIELHAAIMDSGTGKVRFLGGHPREAEIIKAADFRDDVYKDGPLSTLPRVDHREAEELCETDDPFSTSELHQPAAGSAGAQNARP